MARFVNVLIAFLCGVVWLKRTEGWQMAHSPSLQRMVKTLVPTLLHASLCQYLEHMWWLPFWHADSLFMIICAGFSIMFAPNIAHQAALQNVWRHVAPKIFRGEFWGRERLPVGCSSSAAGSIHSPVVLTLIDQLAKCAGYSMACEMQFEIFVGTTPSCVITVARHKLSGLTRAAYLGGAFFGSWWTGLTDHDIQHRRNSLGDIFIAWLPAPR